MIHVFALTLSLWAANWTATIAPPASPLLQGIHEFEIRIEGHDVAQLKDAKVSLEGNMAHPGMVPTYGRARETSPGVYKARLELTMAGDWRITGHIRLKNGERIETHLDLTGVK
jgi:hypothetical protein